MFLILLNILIVTSTYGARILGIVPTPACTHQVPFYPLWKELSLRGHQLTLLTTDPINDPKFTNLTEIDLSSSYKILRAFNIKEMAKENLFNLFNKVIKLNYEIIDQQLQNPKVHNILKNETEHFDLVMMEFMFPVMAAFAERFKCPFILLSPVDAMSANYHNIGNPSHPILNPDFIMAFPKKLDFFHRLMSVASSFFVKYLINFRMISSQQPLVYKHFGNDYPDLEELISNASLFFVHTNPIIHPVRPLLPSVIQFDSGTHLMTSKPLPKDLQQRLDSDLNGFIYFNLGSNIINKLSEDTCQILVKTFAELPCTVLWKFDQEDFLGKPDNVIISKWFPQQDIFRHPKIKLLVTQGSLQSIEEAIFSHIPMIGIPLIGDQPYNVKKVVENGMGLSIDFDKLDKATLKETILEVMNNPKYRNKAKELAELAQDQPMTGLERAIWWTEYVIRHKGAKHLRSPALDIPFYQYFLIDVIGFCLLIVLVILFLIVKITKMLCRFIKRFVIKPKVKTQ